jgi:pimeloyl-ACP methyl ester carboxylesterase
MSALTRFAAMKRVLIPLLALLALLLVACGEEEEAPAAPTVPPEATAPPAATATAPVAEGEAVSFETEDGVAIRGYLFGSGDTAIILSHMRPNDQRAWFDFARELADQGYTALTYDFRGYGETGGDKELGLIDRDLSAALTFMEKRGYSRIYLVGASMGGTASLIVAAREDVAGVVAVSAPARFEGLEADAAVAEIEEPKLFIASLNDRDAFTSLQAFNRAAGEPKDDLTFEGSAHGTELLEGEHAARFKARIIQFLHETGG